MPGIADRSALGIPCPFVLLAPGAQGPEEVGGSLHSDAPGQLRGQELEQPPGADGAAGQADL